LDKDNDLPKWFEGRTLVIATKHGKEKIIAPVIEKQLGVTCIVPENLDTDVLGTFTGEVERVDDPIETLRKKCLLGMASVGCDLAIANEGSFGEHPYIPFLPADEECMMLLDQRHQFEILVKEVSTNTNYFKGEFTSWHQLEGSLDTIGFPTHALIIKKSLYDFSYVKKGISNISTLKTIVIELLSSFGSVYIETDMRAMHNPTRQTVIEAAAQKLLNAILQQCPRCSSPGFGISDFNSGLPCSSCGTPTKSPISYLQTCKKCDYTAEKPSSKKWEDPMYCDYCNP